MNKKFILNLFTSVMAYLITGLASLWIAPYVINNIGVEAYGLIPLVQMTINFMTIITMAFSSMIGRYFTVAKTKNDLLEANEYISTSFYSMLIICTMMLIVIILLGINIESIINVPTYLVKDARWLFIMQGLSFILITLNVTFQAIPYCNNKLYINNINNTLAAFLRAILTIIFMTLFTPYIWQVGFSAVVANLIILVIGYYVYKKLEPNINIKFKLFRIKKLIEMLSLGIWQSINYAGSLFYLQSDVIIANWNLGPEIAGEYSTLIQWSSLIRAFGNAVSSIFSPTYIKLYAQKKYSEIVDYSNKAVAFVGIITGIMAGFIAGAGQALLRVWIGPEFEHNAYLLIIIGLSLGINICISPLFALLATYKKVKFPAIIQIIVGIGNFILAYLVTGVLNFGILGLTVVSFISYSIINVIFMPLYVAKITNQKYYKYYLGVIKSLVSFIIGFIICNVMQRIIFINNWTRLIMVGLISTIIYSAIVFFVVFTEKDRKFIIKFFYKRGA